LSGLPLRAAFERVDGIDPTFLLRIAAPVPVPLPRDPHPTGLPKRVVLELDAGELRILDGDRVLEAWPRGALVARVDELGGASVDLKLRWPDGGRAGVLRARDSPDALAIAEALARDARVASGGDAPGDDTVHALAAATLPARLRSDYADEIRAVTSVLSPGERPLAVAVAHAGIVVLTDRALSWWAGGRREPVVIPRTTIRAVASARWVGETLWIDHGADGPTSFTSVEPAGRAAEIAAGFDAVHEVDRLVAADDDIALLEGLWRELALARERWLPGERGELLARADVGFRSGALLLSDRRLLWVCRKADPIAVARADVAGAECKRSIGLTRLELALSGGGELTFEAVQPRERAELLRSALLR
jgi:hypothetical protein